MTIIKNLLIKLAFWILNKYGVNYFLYPTEEIQRVVNLLVDQVEEKFRASSGEFKRGQVLRASMNSLPNASEREIALAIELSIQRNV